MVDILLILIVLVNLSLLGVSRIGTCIKLIALQGLFLGIVSLAAQQDEIVFHSALLIGLSIIMKVLVFPWLFQKALRDSNTYRESVPFVGQAASLIAGTAALAGSLWFGSRLPVPVFVISPLLIPVALFTVLSGFFIIVTRKKAITQVLGYLALENGIYAFGISLAHKAPLLIELAILLDVFVAVFVMGIAIFNINRTFDHIDTDQMSDLKE